MSAEPVARPIVGFRGWSWSTWEDGFTLLPIAQHCARAAWRPDQPARADHDVWPGRSLHPAPAPNCLCGLNAYKRCQWFDPRFHVTGAIVAWGRIFEHERGFRAEFARPIAFASVEHWHCHGPDEYVYDPYTPARCSCDGPDPCEAAAERYDLPLLSVEELVGYAQWFGDLLPEEAVTARVSREGWPG